MSLIVLRRDIHSHPLFKGRPDRLWLWTWMLANAAQEDGPHLRRGQIAITFREMARACGVGLQTVRTFMAQLEDHHAINTASNTRGTIITICNFDKYAIGQNKGNTQWNASPAETPDPAKEVFDRGVALLGDVGIVNGKARAILGKWRKDHGDAAVFDVLQAAEDAAASDPVSYITAALKQRGKGQAGGFLDQLTHREDPHERLKRLRGQA